MQEFMRGWKVSGGQTFRRTKNAVVALLVVAAGACGVRGGDQPDTSTATPAPPQKYTPSGDEGLGASVAIVVDNSGSMAKPARGDDSPKYLVARRAIYDMLATTDSFVVRQPGFPVNVGLYSFSSQVEPIVPIRPYDRNALRQALATIPRPSGGTAIGRALEVARADLYRAGTIRKYILVVTDGENTDGPSPGEVAREIARRSEGAVKMYFVAFDVDAEKFNFVRSVHGEVLGAQNGVALRASLDTIYRGRILAEAMDAGESLPARRDSAHASTKSKPPKPR